MLIGLAGWLCSPCWLWDAITGRDAAEACAVVASRGNAAPTRLSATAALAIILLVLVFIALSSDVLTGVLCFCRILVISRVIWRILSLFTQLVQ